MAASSTGSGVGERLLLLSAAGEWGGDWSPVGEAGPEVGSEASADTFLSKLSSSMSSNGASPSSSPMGLCVSPLMGLGTGSVESATGEFGTSSGDLGWVNPPRTARK